MSGYLCKTQNTELCCPAVRMYVGTFVEHRIQNCCLAVRMHVGIFVEYIIQSYVALLSECMWVPTLYVGTYPVAQSAEQYR